MHPFPAPQSVSPRIGGVKGCFRHSVFPKPFDVSYSTFRARLGIGYVGVKVAGHCVLLPYSAPNLVTTSLTVRANQVIVSTGLDGGQGEQE